MPQNWGLFVPTVLGPALNYHVLHILRKMYVHKSRICVPVKIVLRLRPRLDIQYTVRNFFPNYVVFLAQPNLHAFFCKAKQHTVTSVKCRTFFRVYSPTILNVALVVT